MNSATTSHKSTFEAEGNAGVVSKQLIRYQNVNLNDGNEIPMVTFLLTISWT
jgi:hypothetical protein